MSTSSIDVTQPLKGIQVLYSTDTVRLNSDTEYSAIFSTGNVIINGTIENTTFIYCKGTITIGENANVKNNLVCYANKVEVNGNIEGNILGGAQELELNSQINGNVKMNVTELNCSETATVQGKIELNTQNENLSVPESVGEAKIDVQVSQSGFDFKQYCLKIFVSTLGNVVIFLLLIIIFKKERLEKVGEKLNANRSILKNGIYSYLALLGIICMGIVLLALLTKLGVAFLIFGAAVMSIVTILKNVIFGVFVANYATQKYNSGSMKVNNMVITILTLLSIEIFETIPYVGEVFKFITFVMALGIFVSMIIKNKDSKTTQTQEVIEAK